MNGKPRILVTGAAGLVGQNLVLMLRQRGYEDIVAVDKHAGNLQVLRRLVPEARIRVADLAEPGEWEALFDPQTVVVMLHAQITGKYPGEFVRNNVEATRRVLEAIARRGAAFVVHVSSSVVNSAANDDYTNTKKTQETLVRESAVPHCVLRPTLMFGWFDPKHLGWLSRFMEKTPVFPIPGHGRYMRQPLYIRDFCRALVWAIENRPAGKAYDVVGAERIDYIEVIRAIKRVKRLKTLIVHVPVRLFRLMLKSYALVSRKPPFTADQLDALCAGDDFKGVDTEQVFGFRQTPFDEALRESYCDPRYSHVLVSR
ncbi:MAG TPA: NAD(P)-dependent oxidoreductase [Usitatibacter sp.]|nr:NAD(P)-dependent oxidoreductase [Usitatibacter sp.]